MRHLKKIRETNGGQIKEQDVPLTWDSPQVCCCLTNKNVKRPCYHAREVNRWSQYQMATIDWDLDPCCNAGSIWHHISYDLAVWSSNASTGVIILRIYKFFFLQILVLRGFLLNEFFWLRSKHYKHYGNTGWGDFKRGYKIRKIFA